MFIRRILFLLLTLAGIGTIYSQKDSINIYQIQYERTLAPEHVYNPIVSTYEYTKFIEFNKDIFKEKDITKKTESSIDEDKNGNLFFNPTDKNVATVFKDYNKNEFYSKHEVSYKYFVVKDSLTIFNWTIQSKQKEILGFQCQSASMNFRGRKYEAWFATDLPIGGPWKFDGLPGMILELKSLDNFITFKAIRVKNEKIKLNSVKNPFKTKKALTWSQFKALYKKKALELFTYQTDENHLGTVSSRGGIEMYISKNDKEYNNALKEYNKKL